MLGIKESLSMNDKFGKVDHSINNRPFETKHILLCFDSRLLEQAKVLLLGIRENLTGEVRVFCVVDNEILKSCEKLRVFAENIGVNLTCHSETDLVPHQKTKARARISYQKYFFEAFTPPNLKKLVYMDIDTLPVRNFDELFRIDFHQPFAGVALDDFKSRRFERWADTMNAGIIVFNVSVWVSMQLASKCLQFILDFPNPENLYDELVINHAYYKYWEHLSSHYNTTYSKTFFMFRKKTRSNIRIVHFMGPRKPWKRSLVTPLNAHLIRTYKRRQNEIFKVLNS